MSLGNIESIIHDETVHKYFEKKYDIELYSKILLLLTHERYEAQEAKILWTKIKLHLNRLTATLGRDPGVAVATLDYLSNFNNSLSSAVIIEEDKSDFISETTTKDGLTQLYLKSVFEMTIEKELQKSFRSKKNLSLLMIDIDDFKKVNDTYGHLVGDEVLRKIGKLINKNVRKMDTAARYGGEEIAIIVPELSSEDSLSLAQRIRKKISKIKFTNFSITVSIGICHSSSNIKTKNDIIAKADQALYKAKKTGKNRVVIYKNKKS